MNLSERIAGALPPSAASTPGGPMTPVYAGSMKVLVVEDDPAMAGMLERALHRAG